MILFLHFTTKVRLQKYRFFTKYTNFPTRFFILIALFRNYRIFCAFVSFSSKLICKFAGSNKEDNPSVIHR